MRIFFLHLSHVVGMKLILKDNLHDFDQKNL